MAHDFNLECLLENLVHVFLGLMILEELEPLAMENSLYPLSQKRLWCGLKPTGSKVINTLPIMMEMLI